MASDWSVVGIVSSQVPLSAIFVLPVLLLLAWIVWDVIDRRGMTYGAFRQFPGPPVWPLIGTMYNTSGLDAATTFDAFRRWTKQYGGSYKLWLNSYLFSLNITRCQEAEPFMSGGRNTDKSLLYQFLHPFIGIGLLNSAGTKWLQRRRILTPTFHFHILNGFHRTFCEESEQLAAKIDSQRISGAAVEIDLQSAMSQLTLNTICETSMGVKLDSLDGAREYREGIYKVGTMMLNRAVRPWLYVDWTYRVLGYKRKLHRLLKPLHLFTNQIIAQRRELFEQGKLNDLSTTDTPEQDDHSLYGGSGSGGKKRYAMLDTLLAAETQGLIDADGIREEVETFTFEGHDTTASALVFIFLTLSWEPEIQHRLYQELRQLHTDKGTTHDEHLSPNDLSSLKFFDRVIKECLRLWPPVAFISRTVTEEIALPDGRTIPKGCIANLHIFDLHRDPAQFPDPEVFDPDRFLPDRIAERNPFAYVPFSAGQRNCIGQKYALLEVKTVVAYLVLRYRILPVTRREEIRFIADLVLPFLLIAFELHVQLSNAYRAGKKFPGPKALPVLGNAHNLLFNDQQRTFQLPRRWAAKYGDTYRILVRGLLNLNAIQAKDVEPLLSSPKLIDKGLIYNLTHSFLGIGLLNSTGTKWQHRRRILTPAFHFNILPSFLLTFQEECRGLVAQLGQYADKGAPVALQPIATKFTLNTICGKKCEIDEEGIREEVDTFMFEGHDTTSAGIIFTLLLLAHSPDVQQRLYEELQLVAGSRSDADGAEFTQRDFNELKYMDMVLKESLRLYPPVPFISRNISEDTMFGDRMVPKDTLFNVHIFDLHRDPAVFPDPERFDPDRFLPENVAERSPYAYVPFSAGLRNCIGQRFAILELKAVLGAILMNFRVLPVTRREELVFVADIILRTKDPIMVKFERR
uniref:Uncharacterized protein n=1 Tax=Anopheles maculatus TaxID=74869 RepID=A0A182S621_9DIPT